MNTITLSNEIKSLYNQLTESAQTILKGCTILCEGVSIRQRRILLMSYYQFSP